MKVYSGLNVYEESLQRIRWIFSEFDDVIVGFSGGKDSTLVFNLTLQVARELGRLPLKVVWIDQECEWQATVDYTKSIMEMPEVKPCWMQVPYSFTNSSNLTDDWFTCWDETKKDVWVRDKDPMAIWDIGAGDVKFMKAIFPKCYSYCADGKRYAAIGGVRTDESFSRYLGMTADLTYKDVTWGKKNDNQGGYLFYPVYDWVS